MRQKDLFVNKAAYAQYAHAPAVEVAHGQNGRFSDFRYYVSNSAYVRRNLVAILIEAPRGFLDLPNPDMQIATLKGLIERQPQTIEGLRATITVDNVENAVGGDGNMQEDLSNVTRERSQPVFTFVEKYGMPINMFLESWIFNLMMNPVDKIPDIVKDPNVSRYPRDLLPDYNSCTVLFFEPDPTFTTIQKAWLCTNMRPKSAGQIEGSRDLTQAGESITYNIEFTALTQIGVGVKNFAQRILNEFNQTGTNPNMRDAFVTRVDADVEAQDNGYKGQVNQASRDYVVPNI